MPDVRPKTLVFVSVATPDRHRDEFQRQGVAHSSQIDCFSASARSRCAKKPGLVMVLREVGGAYVDARGVSVPLKLGQCFACDGTPQPIVFPHSERVQVIVTMS